MILTPIGATAFIVNSVLSVLSERVDLEKRFVLSLFAVLALGCIAYLVLAVHPTSSVLAIVLTAGVGLLASGIAHYVLFKPIRQLVMMAKAIGSGDFSTRLGFDRRDEIGVLALEMDTMCDKLQAAQLASETHIAALEQLRQSDRVATLGQARIVGGPRAGQSVECDRAASSADRVGRRGHLASSTTERGDHHRAGAAHDAHHRRDPRRLLACIRPRSRASIWSVWCARRSRSPSTLRRSTARAFCSTRPRLRSRSTAMPTSCCRSS